MAIAFGLLPALQHTAIASEQLTQLSTDPYVNPDSRHRTQVEPDTFSFGNGIVAAFQVGRFFDGGASNIGWATSTNRGESWTHGFLPSTTVNANPKGSYGRASDASVAFDARHGVWVISYLLFDTASSPAYVFASRSTDGGLTWGKPVVVNKIAGSSDDKNWSVCDDTTSSPFYGHCYTEFDYTSLGDLEEVSTSSDGGLTWGASKPTANGAHGLGGQPLVQPDGTVVVPFEGFDASFFVSISAFVSHDGGASWSSAVQVSAADFQPPAAPLRTSPLQSAEIDHSGKVYVVWSDCRFEPNCRTNDFVLSTSSNGLTWSPPRRIPIGAVGSGVDYEIPGLSVDRRTIGGSAHVGLAYYSLPKSCTASSCQLDVGFVSSTDAGASWSSPEHLAGPMNLNWTPNTTQGRMVGDYISTSIIPGDDDATPVFEVAFAPTGSASCGLSPIVCHQSTYTTPEDLAALRGGPVSTGSSESAVAAGHGYRVSGPPTAH